jgi:PST family polysaccharide transporter
LATTVLSVPQFILSNGLVPVVVNHEKLDDDDLSTAFWSSVGIGVALTLIVLLCAGPVAWLLRNPDLAPILRWSAVPFVFMALGNVPSALYQRRLQYRVFAIRSLVSFFCGGSVGIVLALSGDGVWSLVFNLLVQNVIAGTILWIGLGWRPRFRFDRASFAAMRSNMGHTIAGNLLASVTTRVDMLIIGAFDPVLLGYYYFVQRLLLTISVATYVPIGNLLVSVLRRARGDQAGFRKTFLFMLWIAQALWMPIVAGLGAIAAIMVPNVFGAKWQAAVPLLEIISLTAFTTCFYQFTYSILLTSGRAELYPRRTVVQLLVTIVLMAAAAPLGLAAIGWAYVLVSLLTAILHLAVMRTVLRISFAALIGRFGSVAVATVSMVLAVLWFGRAMTAMPPYIVLPSEIALGAIVYVGVLLMVARSEAKQLTSAVMEVAYNR